MREVLGDSAEHPHLIETLPRRGYRFIGKASEEHPPDKESAPRIRLLVLPFINLTGDSAQEYFSNGMTDEIITALANLAPDRLAVIARSTSMHYKRTRKDLVTIRRELNVDYFVEGGIRRAGNELAVNVQLIRASDLIHLFARKYEGETRYLFDFQDRIAQAIAEHVPVLAENVRSGTMGTIRGPITSIEHLAAYNEYIQARQQMILNDWSPDELLNARQHLEKAIALDPSFALAHDAFAEFHWYLGYLGWVSPRQAFSKGIVHALKALEIDNTRAETHALLGQFHKVVEYNWAEVHKEMSLALEINRNSPIVKMRYAVSELMPQGRLEEGIAELERALEFDPLSAALRVWLGILLVLSRQYDRGIEQGRKILEINPASSLAYFVLSLCHRYFKDFDEALRSQRKAVELSGGSAMMLGWLGLTLAGSGQIAESKSLLQRLHQMAEKQYVPPTSFASIHLGLREIDTAFEWLDRAVDECDQLMMPIKTYAFFDPIRSDPRFASLLHKMNLA